MNKKPRWVIFDVGQVLYDYKAFTKHAAEHLKIEPEELEYKFDEIIDSMLGEMTFEETWKKVLINLNQENKLENIVNISWDHNKFVPDTKLLLKQLHDSGYLIALFTNNWPNATEKTLKNIDENSSIVRYMFESSVEKLRKPEIEFYKLVEKRTGAKAKQIYFIDDKQENLDTAKSLNWQTFLYKIGDDNGKTSNDLIRKQLL